MKPPKSAKNGKVLKGNIGGQAGGNGGITGSQRVQSKNRAQLLDQNKASG